jgi:hypothetical protein
MWALVTGDVSANLLAISLSTYATNSWARLSAAAQHKLLRALGPQSSFLVMICVSQFQLQAD